MSGLSRSDIDDILQLIEHSNFDELRLEMGDVKIELRRSGAAPRAAAGAPPADRPRPGPPRATPRAPAGAPQVKRPEPTPPRTAPPSPATGSTPDHGGVDVPAPQLGIFYHAPRPGEPPFVSVGDEVHPDTVIGIIEVMKLMNTVDAGISGTVTEIVAPNAESVKQGDTLIRVRPF
jgi:acetyl-CoA carboxylase biotin carboxyl carrier protein